MQAKIRGEAPLLQGCRSAFKSLLERRSRRECVVPSKGLTLLELVTVIAIIGILLGIALPSYSHYMLRVIRTEAVSALLELAGCQERVFAMKGRYDPTRCLPTGVDHYTFRMDPEDEEETLTFVAWADPTGAQINDPCGSLGLDQTGHRQASGDGVDVSKCWRARR